MTGLAAARRGMAIVVVVVGLAAGVGCAPSSGSKDKFCAALPKTGDVMSILSDFDSADPAALDKRFSQGLDQFRALERAAPREIRADVSVVADAVAQILAVVRKHPDDLNAIRRELAASATSLASAGTSAQAVTRYAQKQCGMALGGSDPTATVAPTSAGTTSTTTG